MFDSGTIAKRRFGCTGEQGSTIIEFAISAAFIIFAVVGLMDLTQYYSVRASLIKGAQDGLAVAKVIPDFTIDTLGMSDDDEDYEKFSRARIEVFNAAKRVPIGTFVHDGNMNGGLALFALNDGVRNDLATDVVVLRPGDMATYSGPLDIPSPIYHPSICPPSQSSCIAAGGRYRTSSESMESLFRDHPVVVQMFADFRPLTPFIGDVRVKAQAIGYRELSRRTSTQALPALPTITPPPVSSSGVSSSSSSSSNPPSSSSSSSTSGPVTPSSSSSSSSACPVQNCVPPVAGYVCNWNQATCHCDCACPYTQAQKNPECQAAGYARWDVTLCRCIGTLCTPTSCPEGYHFDLGTCQCQPDDGGWS